MNYGFIGFGNLATAIYQGLKNEDNLRFAYFDQIRKNVELPFLQLEELTTFADVIFLTVKPQNLTEVLQQLQPLPREGKVVVSPVAGKSIAFIENYLGKVQPIVRIMPNLAIAYKKSVTAFATHHPNNERVNEIYRVLTKLGKVVEVDENDFDLFTSVFGSGPAFILAFLNVFRDKIREFNLPDSEIDELLVQLTEGTLSYFSENRSRCSIEELIRNVTSKGGTTEAGLNYYYEHHIDQLIEGVLEAAKNRSIEMSKNELN